VLPEFVLMTWLTWIHFEGPFVEFVRIIWYIYTFSDVSRVVKIQTVLGVLHVPCSVLFPAISPMIPTIHGSYDGDTSFHTLNTLSRVT
jgi:hypothetical protein